MPLSSLSRLVMAIWLNYYIFSLAIDIHTCVVLDMYTCAVLDIRTCAVLDIHTCAVLDMHTCAVLDIHRPYMCSFSILIVFMVM